MESHVADAVGPPKVPQDTVPEQLALLHELHNRMRQLTVLQQASRILQDTHKRVEDWLQEIVEMVPAAWQHARLAAARINFAGREYRSPRFVPTQWRLSAEFFPADCEPGTIEVVYLEDVPRDTVDAFLPEEESLLESLAEMVAAAVSGRRSAEALERKQRDLEWLINSIDAIVWEGKPNTLDFSFVSRQAERLLGYPIEFWYRHNFWLDHLHPEDKSWAPMFCANQVVAGRNHDFEYRMIAADGSVVWLHDLVSVTIDDPVRVHGLIVDITERKRADEALRASYQQVQGLASSLIAAKEAERSRIARELHDGVNQQLAAASIGISVLQQRVAPDLSPEISRLNDVLQQAMETVRHLSHELHPAVLRHSGLVAALTSHCQEFGRQHALRVSLDVGDVTEVRGEPAVGLFRITQEALHNVAKHAHANAVHVSLRPSNSQVELSIEDDGRGFDLEEARQSASLGLISIEERVRMLGGTVQLESAAGTGTRLSVRIPRASGDGDDRVENERRNLRD